ncbi:molybdopterin-guanine dinucleotide biosynthesis protein B [Phyllobacterium sp. 21LDTY02-6]|uniref:molybdopterin-guanine dinucleotide biosynthesis protein B n=1 Tax=Phyllobacterium sp. 21LDTY02-6 TaxID=2944903 RepID=UPI00202084F9|nr:molybdopterin-guanine dinucleotide biosynthesis protein B [Phyllobacterium sp. 21LDTY02-6]MCO4316166.1 molybdopterin-guanine dinucleotide biosynthesis protein B [Phyllobacterium sp. 21LDTY02-6]
MDKRIFGITGWKNSGKTTLTERLVDELVRRGWIVSTVKHAHHDFDIDHEGTDSHRHRRAGAKEVAIISDRRWALMHELQDEAKPQLSELIARLAPCDIVLVEGYKRERHKKIEVRRTEARSTDSLAANDPAIVAIAADHRPLDTGLPVYSLNDIGGLADLVERETGLHRRQ